MRNTTDYAWNYPNVVEMRPNLDSLAAAQPSVFPRSLALNFLALFSQWPPS